MKAIHYTGLQNPLVADGHIFPITLLNVHLCSVFGWPSEGIPNTTTQEPNNNNNRIKRTQTFSKNYAKYLSHICSNNVRKCWMSCALSSVRLSLCSSSNALKRLYKSSAKPERKKKKKTCFMFVETGYLFLNTCMLSSFYYLSPVGWQLLVTTTNPINS